MIPSLKKFFLSIKSVFKQEIVESTQSTQIELDQLKKELKVMQDDQKVLVNFCKDTLLSKVKKIDFMHKTLASHEEQLVEYNKLINQHADAINSFLENYKKHIMDPAAHNLDEVSENKHKQRKDN
jgi:Mg2+ and Co2+ transporter CorA